MEKNASSALKKGLLFVNLGSPNAPSVKDVRSYLAEFLMDPYVIDAPSIIRFLIVYGAILPSRPKQTAEAYSKIWTEKGSPLVALSKDVVTALTDTIPHPIALGMRYGNPSIEDGIEELAKKGVQTIKLVPLYPQYAMSTVKTVVEKAKDVIRKRQLNVTLSVTPPFYKDAAYIQSLVEVTTPYISPQVDHLLCSYHGLPVRHLKKTDPTKQHCQVRRNCCKTPSEAWDTCYRHQCFETTSALIEALPISSKNVSVSFQSRLGRDPWLTPFTDQEIVRLAKKGVKHLAVVCPSFVTDCLETLEEIAMEGRDLFLENGGNTFQYIPCLNTSDTWIKTLSDYAIQTPDSSSSL